MNQRKLTPARRRSQQDLKGCPDRVEWIEYAGGLLDPAHRAVLDAHVLGCPACAQLLHEEAGLLKQADYATVRLPLRVWVPDVIAVNVRGSRTIAPETEPRGTLAAWIRDRLKEAVGGGFSCAPAYAAADSAVHPVVYAVGHGNNAPRRELRYRVIVPPTLEHGARFFTTLRLTGAAAKTADTHALVVVALKPRGRRKPFEASCKARLTAGTLRVAGAQLDPPHEGAITAVTVFLRQER